MNSVFASLILALSLLFTNCALGAEQVPDPSVAIPAPIVAPAEIKTVEEVQLTVKDEAFVPPDWLQDALMSLKELPVVGPWVVKVFQWLGFLASFLTAVFAFLWTLLKILQLVLDAGKMYHLSNKLAAIENSKVMYYVKALSMFNAQKKDKRG